MSDQSEHATTRTLWVAFNQVFPARVCETEADAKRFGTEVFAVREVRPGEITLTREELRDLWHKKVAHRKHGLTPLAVLERELFSEGTEVGK